MSKKMKRLLPLIMVLVVAINLSGCRLWTVVKNEETNDSDEMEIYFASDDFDVNAFANDLWENRIFSYYENNQADLAQVIEALKEDEASAGNTYGIGVNDTGSSWQFIVGGTVQIIEVNTESRAGYMTVDTAPYDGIVDASIQIGPVMKGTALRDTFEDIKLDDFANQVEFASISKALNGLVVEKTIGDTDFTVLEGQEIKLLGAFTYDTVDNISVTPIILEALEVN